MKRRALAFSMAAVMAMTSTSICAFAEGHDSKALAAAITVAKTRLDIPEELSEFSYDVTNSYTQESYSLRWFTPQDADEYRTISVRVCGSLILSYYDSENGWKNESGTKLAKLSGDQLYQKAQEQIKKINPTISGVISIDRDSLNINVYSDRAVFSLVRTKNGIPVQNDAGSIVLNKDTGELISFSLNWHEKAAFKDAKSALSEDKAKEKYAQMIAIEPRYEFYYDWEAKEQKCRLVYHQTNYGEINAFTGRKSDFDADGYFEEGECTDECNDAVADKGNPMTGGGGYEFTEKELEELNRQLPYAGEAAVKELLQSNVYLTYKPDMELSYSYLYKDEYRGSDRYYYTASFTNESWSEPEVVPYYDGEGTVEEAFEEDRFNDYQIVSITVDAESGQIINYYYMDTTETSSSSYDLAKADTLAKDIAKQFAGDKFAEYGGYSSHPGYWTDQNGKKEYWGSDHTWQRYANDILVYCDTISIHFGADMTLKEYNCTYTEGELPDPSSMLTKKQIMSKFWENNKLDLYYLARVSDKKTKTVLVYGTDEELYADAFTGEQVYNWNFSYENDLSGIKDKKILKMAQKLDDHGFFISAEKFSEKDAVPVSVFESLIGSNSRGDSDRKLTRGEALVIFTRSVCGDTVPSLTGIYKSPFSDVKDTDANVGYYAIAYGMGVVSGDKLDPGAEFTYGDMIKMVYTLYSAE